MPSARMAPDGELMAGGAFFLKTQHYNLAFQALPWLETTFSYAGLQSFDPLYPVYYDRSFGFKARLSQETAFMPAIAVGISDVVGTGLYSGEYIVASKQLGPVDLTMGLGWGRYGETGAFRNPLTLISKSFETRPTLTTPGGTNLNVYLHGQRVSLFGSAVWHTPVAGLSLIAEYSGDTYSLESLRGNYKPQNQLNLGAIYNVTDSLALGVNWLHGNRFAASVTFTTNPFKRNEGTISPQPVRLEVRSEAEQKHSLNSAARLSQTLFRADSSNLLVEAVWQADVSQVNVREDVMNVTLAPGVAVNLAQRCQDIARRTLSLGADIATVVIVQGAATQRCPILGASPKRPVMADPRLALATPAMMTIDARGTPRNDAQSLRNIRAIAQRQQLGLTAIQFRGAEAFVYYENNVYFSEHDAIDRLTRVLMAEAPAEIELLRFISIVGGVPQREFIVYRTAVERNYAQNELNFFSNAIVADAAPMRNPILDAGERGRYPQFEWTVYPALQQSLFDPSQPLGLQMSFGAQASATLLRGLTVNAGAEFSLFDNFNTARLSDSVLPHVRTDFVNYFTQGKNGMAQLDMQYRFRLSPSVFAIVKAGYLESMFAGAGGEILWRPENQRWALGFDFYGVQQRNFDRLFGLRPYTQVTGHVSLYYQSPWANLDFAVRAGRYLAGDSGLTVEVTRRFATGVEIGAFMTKTNVSAADFGEGSFDKGIIIRIPLGWVTPIDTQGQFAMDLRPVQRDGGQRLVNDTVLFNETRRVSEGELLRQNEGRYTW